MKKPLLALAPILVLAFNGAAQSRFTTQEQETIRRTLEFSSGGGTKILEVDNIAGSIRVTGYDGRAVEMMANKTIRAESQERLQAARTGVKLDITGGGDTVRIYVDEPGRCSCGNSSDTWRNRRRWNDPGYRVKFDFEIRVPRQTTIRLRTVNEGGIHVENVTGDFDVEDVNGSIEMLQMSGSGRVYALNGEIKVTFASNPKQASYFGSLNGDIEAAFQPNFSAGLSFKTFRGGVYTDFPVTPMARPSGVAEKQGARFVYRNDGFSNARAGNGGPEIKFDGFNGDVRILVAK